MASTHPRSFAPHAPRLLTLMAMLFAALLAPSAYSQSADIQMLFGQKMKPFIDPAGYYAVMFPQGFNCTIRARRAECDGNRGGRVKLVIDVVDTPASATPEMVLLNEMERYQKQPHFQKGGQQKLLIDGIPAVEASFSYDYMGNVERGVGVKVLYLVQQTKTYVIHFECPFAVAKDYKNDIAMLYESFKPARLDAGGNPILEDLKPKKVEDRTLQPDVNRALNGSY